MRNLHSTLTGCLLLGLCGCQTMYYESMEAFGVHKREILVDRVVEARDSQEEAKEQFASALDRFTNVVDFSGGKLEEHYSKLQSDLDRSEARAQEVRDRVDAVEDVAEALFREWEKELDQYTNDSLRRKSERQMRDTHDRYDDLIDAMRRAESHMDPVLAVFRDNVLFLKHNLNAQAIASLEGERVKIEADVAELIAEMEASIQEADEFVRTMTGES